MDNARRAALSSLEERIGYKFNDAAIMDVALTHTSYVKGDGRACEHNERLEFLGDAVLELCVSVYLYKNYPDMDEGHMTRIRSLAVYERALYSVAEELEIGKLLMLSRGEEHSGGREKPSILADAVEALIGAIYIDGGIAPAGEFILKYAKNSIVLAVHSMHSKDYKTMLQEYAQKKHAGNAEYEILEATGPDHKKVFKMSVSIMGEILGTGEGKSKQEAGQEAARAALTRLKLI